MNPPLKTDYERLCEESDRLDAIESLGLTLECRTGVKIDRWLARRPATGEYWTALTVREVIDAARQAAERPGVK